MAFEQNQQDAFNLRNDTDSLKRLEAELDKATTAIGAAEVAAEEELAEQKLKHLVEQQKLRVKQLEQLIGLEEDSIQELASLRLALSEKQFEARKKELQKETQLIKKAVDEQLKAENKKRKNNKQKTSSSGQASSATNDIKNSAKANTTQPQSTKQKEYTNDGMGSEDKVDLGKHSFQSIKASFDGLKNYLEGQTQIKADLESIIKPEGSDNQASQTSIDFAGELLTSIKETEEAKRKIQEFNENRVLNLKLINAKKEQDAKKGYLAEYQKLQADGFSHLAENMSEEEFAAIRAREDKIEEAAANQHKAAMASNKALDTLRRKDLTTKQKKELLEAQIQKRAAEKDWSKYVDKDGNNKFAITDDMDEAQKAEVQKRRENAAKAEMAVNAAMGALANLAQKLNDQTDKIGEKQAPIDTRLQGSSANDKILGSYWKQLARDMNKIGAVNPYFTQEKFASNIETLVNKGISFDIKQRAFLMTIQEKIANTFDAADGTLLRLIRIQQEDTTAGRLGMESALNSFLNSMYETSEYLTDVASSVRSSLGELQALMEGAAGTELEFQIQKWMGSLYSVGMSQDAVQSIAQTFGQIASGDVSGLTGSGTGNLLIMAANEAGMSIADILQEGLDADETNKLMQAMVNYLAEIAETSSDSRVVQQQLANVYGIKASDLRAATNLASSIKDVSNQDLTYSGMLGQLNKMANTMILRTSTGEMLSNVWDNVQYTMATQMANDPILYLLPRVATLLEDYAGGIDLPFVNVMGFGVDLNTSVAQLMNVAAMSGSILGALGPMISGLAGAVSGSAMLSLAGINASGKAPVIARGAPTTLQNVSGSSISESGYIGNSSGDDVKNATLQDAEDSKKKQMIKAKDEESSDDIVIKAQLAAVNIYNLLEEVAHGSQSLRVRVINSNAIGGAENSNPVTSTNLGTDNGNWVLSF